MLKVGITGPESSGKTTLAKYLSNILNASYIPEYARLYLEENGPIYTEDDVINIAHKQIELISSACSPIVICDTECLVLNIWMDFKYQHTPVFVTDSIKNNICDIYILCKPDIPWEDDILRENPNDRDVLYNLYKQYLNNYNLNYIIVQGNFDFRIQESIKFIKSNL